MSEEGEPGSPPAWGTPEGSLQLGLSEPSQPRSRLELSMIPNVWATWRIPSLRSGQAETLQGQFHEAARGRNSGVEEGYQAPGGDAHIRRANPRSSAK